MDAAKTAYPKFQEKFLVCRYLLYDRAIASGCSRPTR